MKEPGSIEASNEPLSTEIAIQRSIQGSHLIPLSALLYYPNIQIYSFSALKDKSVKFIYSLLFLLCSIPLNIPPPIQS